MPASPESPTASVARSADPRFLWNEIVRWTLEACILRKENREGKVREILQERLPTLIRAWSLRCGQAPEACKEQLRSLFVRSQETVEFGFIQRRLIVEEICGRIARMPGAVAKLDPSAPVQLRRRVPIGDVSDMLDALAEAEFESLGEALLPVRRAIAPPPQIFAEEPAAQSALVA